MPFVSDVSSIEVPLLTAVHESLHWGRCVPAAIDVHARSPPTGGLDTSVQTYVSLFLLLFGPLASMRVSRPAP